MRTQTSANGRKLIEQFEGCSLHAYLDQRGIPTIGYGHTQGATMGQTCTQAEADAWLAEDLATAEQAVSRLVKVPLTQNQFDALVSLCYNIGQGNFAESTVLRLLNAGSIQGSAEAILMPTSRTSSSGSTRSFSIRASRLPRSASSITR